ncbi:hypothetical protein WR25_12307 [Diploscapter pachys]|uniref:Ephrin RBD domain-containing protein n=1 Tax=Diploscapter pachys TaxID=2018661 RepID=A0A2A2JV91_9BILA|nr:hypothetical protein WR25_12307 [Diploscapter pachys]
MHTIPEITAQIGDQIRFVCPKRDASDKDGVVFIVYKVGDLAFGDCLLETQSQEILRCDEMTQGEAKTANFGIRKINPLPDGPVFFPGERYFYITTSKGSPEGLNSKSRGLCESENMRVELRVADKESTADGPLMDDVDSFKSRADYDPLDYYQASSPRFRTRASATHSPENPQAYAIIPPSAGVGPHQFDEVAKLAKQGKTGTFHNQQDDKDPSGKWRDDGARKLNMVTDELWDTEGKQRSLDNVRRTSLANVDKIADSAVDKTANEPDYIVHEETPRSYRYSADFSLPSQSSLFSLAITSLLMLILTTIL